MAYRYGRSLRGAAGGLVVPPLGQAPGRLLPLDDDERAACERLGADWDRWVSRGRWDPQQPWEDA